MTTEIEKLKQERAGLIEKAKGVLDKAEGESRALNAEENEQFNKMHDDAQKLAERVSAMEKQKEVERSIAETTGEEVEKRQAKGEKADRDTMMEAARSFFAYGTIPQDVQEEWRALQAGNDTEGGFLVMPEQFVNRLIKAVDDAVYIRQRATVVQVPSAMSLGVPSLDADPDDADWTTELATGSEDSTMAFGKRQLYPHPFAKRIKVSNTWLRKAMLNPENLVLNRLAYKFAITEEKGFLTGSGANQPLGLFTASSQGISTSRDVSEGNTATSMTFDGLISALYSLKAPYRANADFLFHRDGLKQLAKLKDGEGQYIWRASVVEGRPDTVLGRPMTDSEYVPNTFATGQYVGLVGDMSHYVIADAMDLQIQRLAELYAETNQTGFIGRKETDGMPDLEEAFARIKLA